jgi:hypothetical protein
MSGTIPHTVPYGTGSPFCNASQPFHARLLSSCPSGTKRLPAYRFSNRQRRQLLYRLLGHRGTDGLVNLEVLIPICDDQTSRTSLQRLKFRQGPIENPLQR